MFLVNVSSIQSNVHFATLSGVPTFESGHQIVGMNHRAEVRFARWVEGREGLRGNLRRFDDSEHKNNPSPYCTCFLPKLQVFVS